MNYIDEISGIEDGSLISITVTSGDRIAGSIVKDHYVYEFDTEMHSENFDSPLVLDDDSLRHIEEYVNFMDITGGKKIKSGDLTIFDYTESMSEMERYLNKEEMLTHASFEILIKGRIIVLNNIEMHFDALTFIKELLRPVMMEQIDDLKENSLISLTEYFEDIKSGLTISKDRCYLWSIFDNEELNYYFPIKIPKNTYETIEEILKNTNFEDIENKRPTAEIFYEGKFYSNQSLFESLYDEIKNLILKD